MRASHLLLIFLVIGLIHLDLIDARKKGKRGKKGKKGKKGKGNQGKRPKPTPSPEELFGAHTNGNTCQCWFDLTRNDCGCCVGDAVQCGDPMGEYCWKPPRGKPMGCPGIIHNEFTLSQTGHPCFWDHGNRSCAFCVPGSYKKVGQAFQCGNYCDSGRNTANCRENGMHLADCKAMGKDICDVNAKCTQLFTDGSFDQTHKCVCNEGWRKGTGMPFANRRSTAKPYKLLTLKDGGHGLACQNDTTGEFSEVGHKVVEVEMQLTLDTYYDIANSSFSSGPDQESLVAAMMGLIDAGKAACSGCNATMVSFNNTMVSP